jgi:hypothetical protein
VPRIFTLLLITLFAWHAQVICDSWRICTFRGILLHAPFL